MAWQTIAGAWGTHVADLSLANAWLAEWRRRVDAARPLVALGSTTPWSDQRAAVLDAWHAAGFTYTAANIPPPSDPVYRQTMLDWYGYCRTTKEGQLAYEVRGLVSVNGGGTKMRAALDAIWASVKRGEAPRHYPLPVRASLGSDGSVFSMCLEATGDGDCGYRGLFTGCANTTGRASRLVVAGEYREVSCDEPYSAETFEWYDGPAGGRQSPPFRLSLDVLSDLLEAWAVRGDAGAAIDAVRSFVAITNTTNAMRVGLTPSTYLERLLTAEARLDQATRLGGAQHDPFILSGIGVATAVCVAAAGPFAGVCAAGGAVLTAAYLLSSMGRIAPLYDSLGMPLAIPGPGHGPIAATAGPVRVGWLASVLAMPDAAGVVPLSIPAPPAHLLTPWEVLGGPVPMGNMLAKYQRGQQPITGSTGGSSSSSSSSGMLLVGALVVVGLVMGAK